MFSGSQLLFEPPFPSLKFHVHKRAHLTADGNLVSDPVTFVGPGRHQDVLSARTFDLKFQVGPASRTFRDDSTVNIELKIEHQLLKASVHVAKPNHSVTIVLPHRGFLLERCLLHVNSETRRQVSSVASDQKTSCSFLSIPCWGHRRYPVRCPVLSPSAVLSLTPLLMCAQRSVCALTGPSTPPAAS